MKKFLLGALALLLLPTFAFAQSLNPTPGTGLTYSSEKAALTDLVLRETGNANTAWNYVAVAGGITDTTAVTIKTAAGAGKKIWLKQITFSNSGAGTSEFSINCGAAGTSLYRGFVQAAQPTTNVIFAMPKSCTANTLLEVKLVTGTTMLFRLNAAGYTD